MAAGGQRFVEVAPHNDRGTDAVECVLRGGQFCEYLHCN
jgi:hypothetical protein